MTDEKTKAKAERPDPDAPVEQWRAYADALEHDMQVIAAEVKKDTAEWRRAVDLVQKANLELGKYIAKVENRQADRRRDFIEAAAVHAMAALDARLAAEAAESEAGNG